MNCPICESAMARIFNKTVLGKYPAIYFKCPECDIIKPESPHWLAESYASAIAETDVGLVSRNIRNRDLLAAIFTRLHPPDAKMLDVGGGYGLLCRMLRDKGWNCFSIDSYCQNIFARRFEPDENFKAPTLLAFEVFEHIEDPLAFVREQIALYDSQRLIFSTLTHQWDVPPDDWWYYAFETGQHISLYTRKTLETIAQRLGWHAFSSSDDLHILSKEPLDFASRVLLNRENRIISRGYRIHATLSRRSKSLTSSDYEIIKADVKRQQTKPIT
jgi:hypothetical protein